MTDRALIIAVETYNRVTDGFTARTLAGTLDAALDFKAWLLEKWAREGTTGTISFCSSPQLPGERGATKEALVDALLDLEQKGTDSTDNLYVYFSGHGFRLAGDSAKLSDVIVAADFVSTQRSADCCLKLDALIDGLRGSLGHGCHFYFIDACRNEVSKAIAGSLIPFSMAGGEEPSVFVLQSTVAGSPALVAGPFSKKLREGLRGAGKAKVWDPPITDSMKVRFDSLRRYLKEALKDTQPITQSTSGELGESEAVLSVISPVAPVKLTIAVPGDGAGVTGVATVTAFDGAPAEHPITADTTVLQLPPKHYTVKVRLEGVEVEPASIVTEAFEDVVVTFQRSARVVTEELEAAVSRGVVVVVPAGAEVVLSHAAGGRVHEFRGTERVALQPGPYLSTLRDREGHVLRREEVTVTDDVPSLVTGGVSSDELAGGLIGNLIRPRHEGNTVAGSSARDLGVSTLDPDPHVRLALLGAARALNTSLPDSGSPGRRRPRSARGAFPVHVFAARPAAGAAVHVSVHAPGSAVVWRAAGDSSIALVTETMFAVPPGQQFVSVSIDAQPTYTVASLVRANHATLIVMTFDDEWQRRISQYLLPIGQNRAAGRTATPTALRDTLRNVYRLAQMIRAFRKRRQLAQEFTGGEVDRLLTGAWPDPIGAALSAYELVRRRKTAQEAGRLAQAPEYLARAFPELPDTAAIARLAAGGGDTAPTGVPLFLDGLRAFPDLEAWRLPYPSGLLDFGGPWTAWKDAVPRPGG